MPDVVVQTQVNLVLSRKLGRENDRTHFIDKETERSKVAKMGLEFTAKLKDHEHFPLLYSFSSCYALTRMPDW